MSIEAEAAALFAEQPKPGPLTREQASLAEADRLMLHYTGRQACTFAVGPRGGETLDYIQARPNGKLKCWKRDPHRFSLPVKRGLYEYSYATNTDAHNWHLAQDCPALKAAAEWQARDIIKRTVAEVVAEVARLEAAPMSQRLLGWIEDAAQAGQAQTRIDIEQTAARLIEREHEHIMRMEAKAESGGQWEDIRLTSDADNYADWEAGRR